MTNLQRNGNTQISNTILLDVEKVQTGLMLLLEELSLYKFRFWEFIGLNKLQKTNFNSCRVDFIAVDITL